MRFLLDENVSFRVAAHLKAVGLDAVHVGELGLTSTDDTVILSRAGRGLDPGQLIMTSAGVFRGDTSPSVILICDIQALRSAELAGLLVDGLASGLAEMLPEGVIASLTPDRVRVRPLPLAPAVPTGE